MDKSKFDLVCNASPLIKPYGNSFSYMYHGICIGTHWYSGDHAAAVFVENKGNMLYSNINCTNSDELQKAVDEAIVAFNDELKRLGW